MAAKTTAVQPLRKALAFIASLKGDNLKLFNKYVAIRKSEGLNFAEILAEILEHLPDIIAFITAIVSLFNSQNPTEEFSVALTAAHAELGTTA